MSWQFVVLCENVMFKAAWSVENFRHNLWDDSLNDDNLNTLERVRSFVNEVARESSLLILRTTDQRLKVFPMDCIVWWVEEVA